MIKYFQDLQEKVIYMQPTTNIIFSGGFVYDILQDLFGVATSVIKQLL